MKAIQRWIVGGFVAVSCTFAMAHEFKAGNIRIGHPFARATAPGLSTGGAYLTLHNEGAEADKLVGASTPAAERVEIHSMAMDGDVMRMREIKDLAVPPKGHVEFKPGGYHLMLIGLKQPLKQGDKLPLILKFEKAGEAPVTVNVESPTASHDMKH